MECNNDSRIPLPTSLLGSMKKVLHTLKANGECPIHWRSFSKRYKSITMSELDPEKYEYRCVQDMLEYMAECGDCEMLLVPNKGVCVTTKMKVYDMDMDLTMLDLPWTETGILPVGAVEDQYLAQQVFDIYEGGSTTVQVTEVVSLDKIWFCLLSMVKERDRVMEELHDFYTKYEGKNWKVHDKKYCWSGRMMVAPYKLEGYHRVMVRRTLKNDLIIVLFVDFGTVDKVRMKDVRLLHKRFLELPAQAILARMWGVTDVIGKEVEAKKSLVQLVSENVFGLLGTVMAGVNVGCKDRRKGGSVEDGGRPALWLQDLDSGTTQWDVINEILVHEQLADWNIRDIVRFSKQQGEILVDNKTDMDSTDLVLDIFEQLDACGKGHKETSVESEKDELQTQLDDNKRSNGQIKIITIEDSDDSDDEAVVSKNTPSAAPATTSEMPKFFSEEIFYGPPPLVASQATSLSYTEYGGAMVVQVDSVLKQ